VSEIHGSSLAPSLAFIFEHSQARLNTQGQGFVSVLQKHKMLSRKVGLLKKHNLCGKRQLCKLRHSLAQEQAAAVLASQVRILFLAQPSCCLHCGI